MISKVISPALLFYYLSGVYLACQELFAGNQKLLHHYPAIISVNFRINEHDQHCSTTTLPSAVIDLDRTGSERSHAGNGPELLDDNEEQLRASTGKLLDLVERESVALVIFGHDGQQWQTLKKVPAYYE